MLEIFDSADQEKTTMVYVEKTIIKSKDYNEPIFSNNTSAAKAAVEKVVLAVVRFTPSLTYHKSVADHLMRKSSSETIYLKRTIFRKLKKSSKMDNALGRKKY